MCDAKGIPFSHASIGGMFGFFFSEELPRNFDEVVKTNDELFIKFFNTGLKEWNILCAVKIRSWLYFNFT